MHVAIAFLILEGDGML